MTRLTPALVRCAVTVAVVATGLTGLAAHAATPKPKPVCDLISAKPTGAADPSLDITSADIATNATTVTTVIRVAKLGTGTDMTNPWGRRWNFTALIGTANTSLSTNVFAGPFGVYTNDKAAKATLDPKHNEVRYSIPISALEQIRPIPGGIRNGVTAIRNLQVSNEPAVELPDAGGQDSFYDYDLGGTTSPAQGASTPKVYIAGTPSCVKVGS